MRKWHQLPLGTRIKAYTDISYDVKLPAFAIEKDWWVVQTLAIIFEMEIGKHLVFKGGTSLSKAWNLIERFSEDVDLAVDRSFFGFNGELTKRKEITRLRNESNKYITEKFFPELSVRFIEKGLTDVKLALVDAKDSDQDPRIIEIYYPNVIPSPGYIQPRVQVEIGCRSLKEPFSVRSFKSLIDQTYPDTPFAQKPINIPTVNPERTLLEKVFLLHEEFKRPIEKIRVDRLSRHLYDVYQLSQTEFADKAIADKTLYETIVNHRYRFAKLGGVDYNLHQPQTICIIPIPDVITLWEKDYKVMQEQMIHGASPSFKELIENLTSFNQKINGIDWKIEGKFKSLL
ncbi:nucleotidyl transferase AbiEii/AbiGii toxin family protein [Ancylomarina salipaludis]|uniref:Nucleotidyl transferase AbiEii/AbiGii toxin family protein n=1 Tax=Ancylomarina salipaludis TaxID=2501299 RepID=A0A4Q1JPX5_9BACT|nr:nucleotidyl transferase AbiEii/AbiGii toxin family protein [Ancylomarina salipaludis]RXQ97423.1 nucleotidyl transferase AbiEii/AbiGii toxin family protein [Ancylomarina salipaludis]